MIPRCILVSVAAVLLGCVRPPVKVEDAPGEDRITITVHDPPTDEEMAWLINYHLGMHQ